MSDLVWSEQKLRRAIDAASVALFSWNVDTDQFEMDKRGFDLWGIPQKETVCFEDLSARIHPRDRNRVRTAFTTTRAVAGDYEIDFRIVKDDEIRWIAARGQGNDDGIAEGRMYGIFIDVTGRKQAEEGNELLAGEMSHRVRNLLTIASSLTLMSEKSSDTKEQMARELIARLSALGRAHDFIRPVPGQSPQSLLLGDLVAILLAPYNSSEEDGKIRVSVPRIGVGENSSTTLALTLHELATNSIKYGGLSNTSGTIDVTGYLDGDNFVLTWAEGGTLTPNLPKTIKGGFGNQMLEKAITRQFGGSIEYDWGNQGLVVRITMRRSSLAQ